MKRTTTLGTIVVLALVLVLVAGLSVQLPQGAAHAQDPERDAAPQGVSAPQALLGTAASTPLGTAFTYQGKLTDGGSPADGPYDLRFRLYDAVVGGALLGTVNVPDHQVTAGFFTVQLDFGEVFTGTARYLQIAVRPGASGGAYTPLTPRQELTPAPYALALPGLWTQQNPTSTNIIGGHDGNWITGGVVGATIGGGGEPSFPNRVTADYGTVAGGRNNAVGSSDATIGGGIANDIGNNSDRSTIGGGFNNNIASNSEYATIGGGHSNDIRDNSGYAIIGGGAGNDIGVDSDWTTIGGGLANDIGDDSHYAVVGGGYGNDIGDYSSYATIGGGGGNLISGTAPFATIPGGFNNEANGNYAFAAGRRAIANHDGAFVWADSTDADFASQRDDQFRVRANGGVRLDVNEGEWFVFRREYAPPVANYVLNTSVDAYLSTGGTWTDSSDRNAKENFSPVDSQAVLSLLNELPITTWNYKAEDPSIRHMGPTAQDFAASFGLGADDTHLAALDTSGVALAAIQGLYAQNQELAAENAALKSQVSDLEIRLTALERGGVSRSPALGLSAGLLLGGLVLAGGVALQRRVGGGK